MNLIRFDIAILLHKKKIHSLTNVDQYPISTVVLLSLKRGTVSAQNITHLNLFLCERLLLSFI